MSRHRNRVSIAGWALRIDVRERLRCVCGDWPESQFDALVDQIVQITEKYEGYATATVSEVTPVRQFLRQIEQSVEQLERESRLRQSRDRTAPRTPPD